MIAISKIAIFEKLDYMFVPFLLTGSLFLAWLQETLQAAASLWKHTMKHAISLSLSLLVLLCTLFLLGVILVPSPKLMLCVVCLWI